MLKKLTCLAYLLLVTHAALALSNGLDSLKQVVETLPEDSSKCVTLINISLILYSGEACEVYAHRGLELAKKLAIKATS